MTVSASEPEDPKEGDKWLNTTDKTLRIFSEGAWVEAEITPEMKKWLSPETMKEFDSELEYPLDSEPEDPAYPPDKDNFEVDDGGEVVDTNDATHIWERTGKYANNPNGGFEIDPYLRLLSEAGLAHTDVNYVKAVSERMMKANDQSRAVLFSDKDHDNEVNSSLDKKLDSIISLLEEVLTRMSARKFEPEEFFSMHVHDTWFDDPEDTEPRFISSPSELPEYAIKRLNRVPKFIPKQFGITANKEVAFAPSGRPSVTTLTAIGPVVREVEEFEYLNKEHEKATGPGSFIKTTLIYLSAMTDQIAFAVEGSKFYPKKDE